MPKNETVPTKALPSFEKPPVIEVVYGAQIESPRLVSPAIGLFWQRIRTDYPSFEENPPLSSRVEKFDDGTVSETQVELVSKPPLPRVWFLDPSKNWVLQLQEDRFLHNWRRIADDDVYPRYESASSRFFKTFESFSRFCVDEGMGQPVINQLELTYINHIPTGETSDSVEEITAIFPDFQWRSKHSFLPRPESLTWKTTFLVPEKHGRLHVSLRPALRKKDKALVLFLELTVRGMAKQKDLDGMKNWFQIAREWIVFGFADLTDQQVQKNRWGRRV